MSPIVGWIVVSMFFIALKDNFILKAGNLELI